VFLKFAGLHKESHVEKISPAKAQRRKVAKSQGRKVAEAKAQSRKVAKGERKPLRNAAALCAFAPLREKISSLENHMLPQDESR
jgi:hypothetical protein